MPFDVVCFKKIIQREERSTVFLQHCHRIWCIRETNELIGIGPVITASAFCVFAFRIM